MLITGMNPEAGLKQFSGTEARTLVNGSVTHIATLMAGDSTAPTRVPSELRGFKAAVLAGLAHSVNATLSLGEGQLAGWPTRVSDTAFGAGVRISDGETYFRVDLVIDPAAEVVRTEMRARGGSTSFTRPVFIEQHGQALLDAMGQAFATASGTRIYMKATA